jgi:hypothetical protein
MSRQISSEALGKPDALNAKPTDTFAVNAKAGEVMKRSCDERIAWPPNRPGSSAMEDVELNVQTVFMPALPEMAG